MSADTRLLKVQVKVLWVKLDLMFLDYVALMNSQTLLLWNRARHRHQKSVIERAFTHVYN